MSAGRTEIAIRKAIRAQLDSIQEAAEGDLDRYAEEVAAKTHLAALAGDPVALMSLERTATMLAYKHGDLAQARGWFLASNGISAVIQTVVSLISGGPLR